MFKHTFGVSNVKTSSDLKKVKIGSSARERASEVWATDEVDALHVSILDADLRKSARAGKQEKYADNLINPFGIYESQNVPLLKQSAEKPDALVIEADSSIPTITTSAELTTSTASETSQTVSQNNESPGNAHSLIGIYSPNLAFLSSLQRELESMGQAWVYCFDGGVGMSELSSSPQLDSIGTWIINLQDDDESELLDAILEESADADSLYLSGSVLSKLCRDKLSAFMAIGKTH